MKPYPSRWGWTYIYIKSAPAPAALKARAVLNTLVFGFTCIYMSIYTCKTFFFFIPCLFSPQLTQAQVPAFIAPYIYIDIYIYMVVIFIYIYKNRGGGKRT